MITMFLISVDDAWNSFTLGERSQESIWRAIMGKGIANPVGTFWSAVMMLEHLGEGAAATRLMKAIERVTADPRLHTPDLGGKARTADVTAGVIEAIQRENA